MKTVKYLAEKGCKVKVNGKYYSGDDVIPTDKISEDELKKLIAARFIRKINLNEKSDDGEGEGTGTGDNVGNGDGAGNGGGNSGEKPVDEMSIKELKAKAKELGLDVGKTDNEDEIRKKIKEAQGS